MDFIDSLIGRPNTIKTYRGLFHNHINPHIPNPTTFTNQDLNDLVKQWQEHELGIRTIQSLLNLVKRYVEWSGGRALNTRDISRVISRAEQETTNNVLSYEEAKKLIKVCQKENEKFYPILLCALHGGMRRGEIFGLKCGDIDYLTNKITIRRSYEGPTKNGKTRIIPMTKSLSESLIFTATQPTTSPVFKIIQPGPVLSGLCVKAEVKNIRFHDLRHTFATIALEAGVSPKDVQQLLGHSNLTTTLNVYWNSSNKTVDLDFLP